MNSQVPSKVFCGEGPQLAWGEESAKRSERVCAAPLGESVLDASMMAELIVTKKEIWPQLKKSTGTSEARTKSPDAGGQRLPLAGRHGAEHLIIWFCGSGALLAAGFAASVRTPVEGKIGKYTAAWTSTLKAIRKIGNTGNRQRSDHAGLDMGCRVVKYEIEKGTPTNGVPSVKFDLPIGLGA